MCISGQLFQAISTLSWIFICIEFLVSIIYQLSSYNINPRIELVTASVTFVICRAKIIIRIAN